MNVTYLHNRVRRGSQSWCLDAIANATTAADNAAHKLRIFIKRDGHTWQSKGTVERWDGTQWHQVVFVWAHEIGLKDLSYTAREVDAKTALLNALPRLLARAEHVLEPAGL